MLTKGKGIRWSVTQTPHLIPFAEKGRSITVTSKAKEFVLLEIAKRLFNDYEDVCKRDLKALVIDINGWETLASERSAWRQAVQQGLSEFENTLAEQAETKRQTRKARNQGDRPATDRIRSLRGRDCHSRIGLFSHTRRCSRTTNQSATPSSFETRGCQYMFKRDKR